MDQFLNAIRAQSAAQDGGLAQPRFGVVSSLDAQAGTVRVLLQPDGVLTGWLPVLSPWVGAGWGLSCPPSPGDQVLVLPHDGDAEQGAVVARAWSSAAPVPPTPAGELWLTHRAGSFVRLVNDGTIRVRGDLHVEGSVIATGEVQDHAGTLDRLRQAYNRHRHADPQGSVVGKTDAPD